MPASQNLEERVRLALRQFRTDRCLTQKEFSEALGWPGHLLPDLEIGKVKWSLDRLGQVCRHFQVSPDFFVMGPAVHAEKAEFLKLLEAIGPRKRRLLGMAVRKLGIDDPLMLEEFLRMARRISSPGARRRTTPKPSHDS